MLRSQLDIITCPLWLVFCGIVVALIGVVPIQAQDKQSKLELPMDTDSPILSLAYEGGFRRPQAADFQPTPLISLYADGRAVTGGNSPQQIVRECQLPEQFWQDLVASLMDEHQFLSLDSQNINDDIEKQAEHKIMDAPTSVITLRLANRTHRVEVYGSLSMASQVTESIALQQFVAVEKRLRNLYSIALTGGLDEVDSIVVQIQELLLPQYPSLSQLSAKELLWCSRQASGDLRLEFALDLVAKSSNPPRKLKITYSRVDGKTTIQHQLQEPPPDKSP